MNADRNVVRTRVEDLLLHKFHGICLLDAVVVKFDILRVGATAFVPGSDDCIWNGSYLQASCLRRRRTIYVGLQSVGDHINSWPTKWLRHTRRQIPYINIRRLLFCSIFAERESKMINEIGKTRGISSSKSSLNSWISLETSRNDEIPF